MEKQNLPITDVREMVVFLVMLVMFYDEDLRDGLDIPEDFFSAAKLFRPGTDAFTGAREIIPQLLDMDAAEYQELKEAIMELDISDDAAEVIIQVALIEGIQIFMSMNRIVIAVKEQRKTKGGERGQVGNPVKKLLELKRKKNA
jgi:hypothetical protein